MFSLFFSLFRISYDWKTSFLIVSVFIFFISGPNQVNATSRNDHLIISVASSLLIPFKELIQSYNLQYGFSKIILNSGASDILFQQIVQGAPARIFISADQEITRKILSINSEILLVSKSVNLVRNELVLVVPYSATICSINSLEDLKSEQIKRIAYGNPSFVPVGRYTKQVLENLGLWEIVQEKGIPTKDARQSLNYILQEEVDAGFIFFTDALSEPKKIRIVLNLPTITPIIYSMILVCHKADDNMEQAEHFFHYVYSSSISKEIFLKYGFKMISSKD